MSNPNHNPNFQSRLIR